VQTLALTLGSKGAVAYLQGDFAGQGCAKLALRILPLVNLNALGF